MGTKLDYNASVPINPSAPFSVNVDPNKPPGDRFKDYIPRGVVTPVKASNEITKKNFMKPPMHRSEKDYVSGDESSSKRERDKVAIIELAKQIYADEKNRRDLYNDAVKTVESGKANEAEMDRANKIISKMKPLTKEEALEKATRQFYGVRA